MAEQRQDGRRVLVSGAGIAGPALAHWLGRAGFEVTVVERSPRLRGGGQAIDLRGAGRTVIERMGLLDRARARTLTQHGIAYVDHSGRIRARITRDEFGGEGLISEIELLRADLVDLLTEASLPATEYLFDDSITELTETPEGVRVGFERGSDRLVDLVVGADGLNSRVRRLVMGPRAPFFRPLGLHTAWFTADASLPLDGWYQMFNAPGGLVASARPGRHPGEVKAALSVRGDLDYDRRDRESQQVALEHAFAGIGWRVPELLAAARTADDFTIEAMGQIQLPSLSRGRVVLLGDAGYCPTPLTGLGTSLALVGAYVLAGELARAEDVRAGLIGYERVLRPYIDRAQSLPPGGAAGYAPRSRAALALIPASIWAMTRGPLRRVMADQAAKAGRIDLPDYRFGPADAQLTR